ncbi:MAG TPA: helix-turn-helix transcriptional regulator [Bacteroidales bacterium]|nr:helix-turn-helix transcriptional regulator [Bacteroidales bacterium]
MITKKFNTDKFKKLIEALKNKGVTKEKLSVELECSFSAIYKWTNGTAVPSPDALYKVIEFCKKYFNNVTFESFFDEVNITK